jgi:hypothetical protein
MHKPPSQKSNFKRNTLLITFLLLLGGVGAFYVLEKTDVVETVRKEKAKILNYEYIPNQQVDINNCDAFLKKDSIYADFREKYRFHFQTMGLAQFPDSSKLILISEPPPHFEIDSIKSICSRFNCAIETKSHKMGYDGNVTDILLLLANATTENVSNIVAKISRELYFSDYKPQIMSLPDEESRVYFTKSNIDYRISLYEFNEWFIESKEAFFTLDDTTHTETIHTIFEEQKRGVFFSRQPGFVAWAIAKKSDLAGQLNAIRQFTLDADLVLGALADSTTLVIIGREREVSLSELPPLNVETILLLASISEKELSQSLDINDLMAGKMRNGKDWCPTYLSKELENTELGHLLTITDILLKDWSEKGTIQEAYYRYPEPDYYPFDKPLFRKLGVNELVYNWNTANAMYAIDLENVTIYTLNRTGSLPVSYFNSQERSVSIGSRYENQAYNYFATIGNTDLARVVQYVAIYQLFTDNEITYSGDVHTVFPENKPYLLQKPATTLMNALKDLTNQQIEHLSDTLAKIKFTEYQKKDLLRQMKDNEQKYDYVYSDEHKEHIFNDVNKNTKEQFRAEFYQVRSMLQGLSEEDFRKLAKYVSYPRGAQINGREGYNTYLKSRQLHKLVWSIGKNHLHLMNIDLNNVKEYYVRNLASSSAKYIKTPSVIITYNDMLTTGGHNISSKISRVKTLTNYKQSNYIPRDYTSMDESPKSSTPQQTQKPANVSGNPKPADPNRTKATPKPVIRPREEVISPAARTQRGL